MSFELFHKAHSHTNDGEDNNLTQEVQVTRTKRHKHETDLGVLGGQLESVLWSLHEQQSRKNFEEQLLDPRRHDVGGWRPEVDVEDEDGHYDGAGDQDHGEEQVLADERRGERRRRVDLGDEQQEDVERVEDRDAHRDLLAGVGRDVEYEQRDRADGHARQDQVHGVEQRLAAYRDVELDVRVRLRAARVVLVVLLRFDSQQIPLCALIVVVQVNS